MSDRGILDIAGTLPKFTIPKGKTLDDLINEAAEKSIGKEIRKYKIRRRKSGIFLRQRSG